MQQKFQKPMTPTDTEKTSGIKSTTAPSVIDSDSSVPMMSSYIATSSLSPYRQELVRTIYSHYNSSAPTAPRNTNDLELPPPPVPSGSNKVCAMLMINNLTSHHFTSLHFTLFERMKFNNSARLNFLSIIQYEI